MSVLIIGPEQEREIQGAVDKARANPVPWEVLQAIADPGAKPMLMMKDRKPGTEAIRDKYPSHSVMLGTYRAAISFEQQPAGLCRHLSVSSRNSKMIPGLEVMKMTSEAFGFATFPPSEKRGRVWVEEFEPGRMAVNVIEIES